MAEGRSTQILIRVTPEEKKEIEDLAWQMRVSMSEAVRIGVQRLKEDFEVAQRREAPALADGAQLMGEIRAELLREFYGHE